MLSTLLIAVLLVGSMATLAGALSLRNGPAIAFGSPSAVATVRAYYAAINHYVATGELNAVQALVTQPSPHENDPGDECAPAPLLSALRRTYPHLHMTVEDLLRDGSEVIARVSVETGPVAGFGSIVPLTLEQWYMTEIFTVADGRLTSCTSVGPGQGLVATMLTANTAMADSGGLVVARLSFSPEFREHLPIASPAIISVEAGTLAVPGNGIATISRAGELLSEVTEPGTTYRLEPGDVLSVPDGRVVLHNPDVQTTQVTVTTIVPMTMEAGEAEASSPARRLADRLSSPDGGDVGAGIAVRVLARAEERTSAGSVSLQCAGIVMTSGGSVIIGGPASETLIVPLTGDPVIERDGSHLRIRNPGTAQARVLVARVAQQSSH